MIDYSFLFFNNLSKKKINYKYMMYSSFAEDQSKGKQKVDIQMFELRMIWYNLL